MKQRRVVKQAGIFGDPALRRSGGALSRSLSFVTLACALLLGVAPSQAASLVGTSTSVSALDSASRFYVQYASGYYWVAYHDGTRPVIASSRNAATWASQGAIFSSFNPATDGFWAVRFSGANVIALGYNGVDTNRYYRNATLNANGSVTWNAADSVAQAGATPTPFNALVANQKPVYWRAALGSGQLARGSQLNGPVWSNPPLPPSMAAVTGGSFSGGATFATGGPDPEDLVVLRATTQAGYVAGNHRLVAVKYDASLDAHDAAWYNVSTLNSGIGESATTEVKPGSDALAHVGFAAVRDTSGNLHAVYVNRNDDVVHYRKANGFNDTWSRISTDVTQTASVIDRVALTAVSGGNLYLLYSKSDAGIYYRRFDGAAWGSEAVLKTPSATPLQGALAPIEQASGCSPGVAWTEGGVSPYNVMFSLGIGSCGELSTLQGAGTLTVTGPAQFEMRFSAATGGAIDRFFDLAEDPTRDLAGGVAPNSEQLGLFIDEINWATDTLAYRSDAQAARLELLEATPVRARVRTDGPYGRPSPSTARLVAARGQGDYSVYPMGRLALNWQRSTGAAVSSTLEQLHLNVHYQAAAPLNGWTAYTQAGVCAPFCAGPAGSDFVMQQIEQPLARTDFLSVLYQDWPTANGSSSAQDPFGEAAEAVWQTAPRVIPAGVETWKLATYFKPTNFASHADPAVTSRSVDYRVPSPISVGPGTQWQDAAENTAGAGDFFNESEAAYVFNLNPATGLSFDLDGTSPRYAPFLKIREWRSFVVPPSITVEGVTKVRGVDYVAAVKPVSRAAFAKDILWYSSLQVALAVTPNQDVGSTGGVSSGVGYVAARYGQGASVAANNQFVSLPVTDGAGVPTGDFDKAKGAVEFWYRPTWNHDDGVQHDIAGIFAGAANQFLVQKLGPGNGLRFRIVASGGNFDCTVAAANYFWRAAEWVHLRFEWDDAAAPGPEQRIVIDQAVPTQTCAGDWTATNLLLGTNAAFQVGDIGDGAGTFGAGVYDELYSFGGSSTTPTPLANGGLATPGREYLGDAAQNFQLSFVTRQDVTFRGPRLFVGSDSKNLGLNVALAVKGSSPDANLRIHYWNGTAWSLLSDTDSALWAPGFSDTSNSLRQNGTLSWTEALVPNWAPYSVNGGPDLYYIRIVQQFGTYATPPTEALITTDILLFQYCGDVTLPAQTFVFGAPPTTEVKLQSFSAVAGDAAVSLEWRTASELDNLGFHVYRAPSEHGPWTRLTASLIPGLGSSAVGQAYAFRDTGLANGTRYFYRLEDVDAASKATSHGPVSAVPGAGAPGGAPGSEPRASSGAKQKGALSSSCPDWLLAAYSSMAGPSASTGPLRCTRHGDPEAVSLEVVSRDSRQATLELVTGGFYALHEASGRVRAFVPGFDFPQDAGAPALPFRRVLVDAVVGRRVRLGGVRALEQVSFKGLVPASLGALELEVSRDGTVRAGRRAARESASERVATDLARLLPSVFQGEAKSAVVQLTPLRYDARRRQIVLAKRLRVKLLFSGREAGESGRGRHGRRERPHKPVSGELLARLFTTGRGLHAVAFEQLFPGSRQRGLAASELRLERQGQAVSFHLDPASNSFGPGGVLYFHAEATAASSDYASEVAWELLRSRDGLRMPLVSATPEGDVVSSAPLVTTAFETNRFYQPGLLEAPDLWLWEGLASGATRATSFSLRGVDAASAREAEIEVFLQGASESGNPIDHHVSVSLNGAPVGGAQFAGKKPYRLSLAVPHSLLREGANELSLANVADTGVSSFVFLDRFAVSHSQSASLAGGPVEGTWAESGTASLGGSSGADVVLDVTGAGSPAGARAQGARWLTGLQASGGTLRFRAEAGHRYLAVSPQAVRTPRVATPAPSTLRAATNRADYLLIAPRAFLAAAEPLVARRQDQGLAVRAVAFEEIADEFGHGQPSAEAIRSFLSHAFHSWARPSPRYALLVGDASYDPRNFTGTSQPSPLPALWAKTSYLWTVSDPQLAAVNGDDNLPDLAIGRLPATTAEQARMLVDKLIAWEDSGQGLSGAAVLVADNPDLAGDFEADAEDIRASFLASREAQLLKLGELGAQTRPAILDALDSGLSYLSYVGHGGAAVWASENVWNSWDAASLQAQSRQPLLLTLNCLNGYFVAPSFDSLSESLLKAEGRGAIAAVSPSGLSLDGPAHQYHRALMAELSGGRHDRLGDALLAAQQAYAQSGLMPELLSVYHLLGDPAMSIQAPVE